MKEGPLSPSEGYLYSSLEFPALGVPFPYFTNAGDTLIHADTARFVYDSVTGNLLKAYNRDARINRSYYPNGALKVDSMRIRKYAAPSDTSSDFNSHRYILQYEYDLAGRRTKLWLPTNLAHSCSPCSHDYHYLAHLGALDTITTHLGNKFTFAYDDKGRLTGRDAQKAGAVDIADLAWAYDLDDRVTRRLERRFGGSTDTVHFDSLWYDARGKITRAALKGSVDSVQLARFQYDRHGYLAASEFRRTVSPDTFTRNQVFDFGANGDMGSVEKNKSLAGATLRSFTYDEGRLVGGLEHATGGDYPRYVYDVSVNAGPKQLKSALQYNESLEVIGGSESAAWHQSDGKLRNFQRVGDNANANTYFVFEEYRYDALGRRVLLRSRSPSCSASYCKDAVERFVWDGNQVLFEMRVPGDTSASAAALETDTSTVSAHYGRVGYVHGGGIDAPLAVYRNGVGLIPHANWRGFHDAGTDTSGSSVTSTVTWISREQSPFMDNDAPATVNGWAGSLLRSSQDQSGLLYRRNRYYDAGSGRFTQTDPIGLRGGANLYGYASGDPVNLSDALGLCPAGTRPITASEGVKIANAADTLASELRSNNVKWGDGPGQVDCSMFVHDAEARSGLPTPPRQSTSEISAVLRDEEASSPYYDRVTGAPQRGDIMWQPGHVGVYSGSGSRGTSMDSSGATTNGKWGTGGYYKGGSELTFFRLCIPIG